MQTKNNPRYKEYTAYLGNFNNTEEDEDIYRHYNFWDPTNNVLNGIAYQIRDDSFILTGKMFDFIYNVRIKYHEYISEKPFKYDNLGNRIESDSNVGQTEEL